MPASTGGTTGVPLKLWRSIECVVAEQAFIDDLLAPYGHSMHGSRVAILRADKVKDLSDTSPPYGRLTHGGRRLMLSTPHMNARTFGWFCEALHEFAPSVLWAYPSAALNLMKLTERVSVRPKFPILLASSETLSSALHLALERHFSCRVINYYGQAERVCFAHSVKPTEFYFNPWYGRVELLRVEEHEEGFARRVNIVATGHWNAAMPLVRYETGDTLLVPKSYGESELADVALGRRPFIQLEGRDGEYLMTGQGVQIIGLNQIPREVANVLQVQLVQREFESVGINVVTTPAFSSKDAGQLLDQAKAKIPLSIQLTLNVVEHLETNARGKAPFVLRMIDSTRRGTLPGNPKEQDGLCGCRGWLYVVERRSLALSLAIRDGFGRQRRNGPIKGREKPDLGQMVGGLRSWGRRAVDCSTPGRLGDPRFLKTGSP